MNRVSSACGQASLMMLAVVGVLLTGALVLFAFGSRAPCGRARLSWSGWFR